ncbi:MAG: CRISPR-associated helicase/endonuclease Cas3, partial [Acidobacteriota bacterium]
LLSESGRPDPPPPLDDALAAPYPAVCHRPAGASILVQAIASDRPEKLVRTELFDRIAARGAVAGEALAAARSDAKVLVIRNTVTDCLATQLALEALAGDDPRLFRCRKLATPHHSRYADADRKQLDQAIERAFGKRRDPGGRIAVATQTVEQSLDLDADLLITDLCPMDVLLQRIGRLHRHQRSHRPDGFGEPRVIVLVPADGNLNGWVAGDSPESTHGLGTVYADLRVLEATWRLLRERPLLRIPRDNRRLVEESLHPERLRKLADELGDAWKQHQETVWGELVTQTRLAQLNGIDPRIAFDDERCLFPDRGNRKIPTRLGLEDRLFRFEPPVHSPFGEPVSELSVPEFLARGVKADVELASDVETVGDKISFRLGTKAYFYDRIGLREADARGG